MGSTAKGRAPRPASQADTYAVPQPSSTVAIPSRQPGAVRPLTQGSRRAPRRFACAHFRYANDSLLLAPGSPPSDVVGEVVEPFRHLVDRTGLDTPFEVVGQERRRLGLMLTEMRSFDELVNKAADVPVDGWDFSWLDGRATEQRPSWGYQRSLGRRLAPPRPRWTSRPAAVRCSRARAPRTSRRRWSPPRDGRPTSRRRPRCFTRSAPWSSRIEEPPTAVRRRRLRPRHQPPPGHGPLGGDRSRAGARWDLLRSACRQRRQCRDQRVLPRTTRSEQPAAPRGRADAASAAGLEIVSAATSACALEFFDVGAVVFFLRR